MELKEFETCKTYQDVFERVMELNNNFNIEPQTDNFHENMLFASIDRKSVEERDRLVTEICRGLGIECPQDKYKYKYGDKVYYVDSEDVEIECYVIEFNELVGKYKLLVKNDAKYHSYVFKEEEKLVQIFPDYWLTLNEYFEA